MVAKINIGSSLFGALSYNQEKVEQEEGKILYSNRIIQNIDGTHNMYLNMMQVSVGKTVFFISHRLSSARIADKIYFLEEGKILEQGTHDELISKNGKYAQMFLLQAQNYRDNVKEQLNLSKVEGQLHA